ncbi:thioredoxin family protein [Thiomicrorhabdus sp. 6S2-11]|uniref:Thioredoxin family protein n=1 Tax=Thiomicrorhabdus marina TaxID=2818442 RepID=A0ABS3Q4P1_9GAMM|nr:thioredoxin family protein [Thiomicrorhabdus marina]MBO1927261.1 thioredoxin family protein [Thiomicrorhabdus marina]
MKGNLMIRLMTLLILIGITLAHFSGQTDLWSANWLWLAILPAFMGLQATFTGWCPAELVGKLSKTGECCPGGSCASRPAPAKPVKESSCCSEAEKTSCCGSQPEEKKTNCCGNELEIKVLGTGCASCNNTVKLIQTTADELGVKITISKVEDVAEIAAYGVMSTPAVVINEQVLHSGGIPSKDMIQSWL